MKFVSNVSTVSVHLATFESTYEMHPIRNDKMICKQIYLIMESSFFLGQYQWCHSNAKCKQNEHKTLKDGPMLNSLTH